jgi:hypothetical protein
MSGERDMTNQAHTEIAKSRLRPARGAVGALTAATLAILSACSGGGGGDDVTIGSGQSADPVTLDFPVFYVKRPVPDPEEDDVIDNARVLNRFEIGADLFMRDRASPSAPEVNLTSGQTGNGLGDIRDLGVNFDGTKLLFSMRARFIANADEEDQPTWNIWEYDATTRTLRRIITSDNIEDEGQDIMPHYLPDGRIVFTSTRQRQSRAILIDEGKPAASAEEEDGREEAFVLHVMNADGTDIHQVSFNQSHDLDPSILADGRIVFTRWEHHIDNNQFDLYAMRPDGTNLQLLYGAHSHNTGTVDPTTGQPTIIEFMKPRPMQDGRMLVLARPFDGTNEGGDLLLIDTPNYVDNTQGSDANPGGTGPAQRRALPTAVTTIQNQPSPGGRYRSAAPLFDGSNRLLVSWSPCRLVEGTRIVPCTDDRLRATNPAPVEAPPLFGLYVYDVTNGTQRPMLTPQEGFIYTEVVAGSQRALPPVLLDRVAGVDYAASLLSEAVGVLHIRSVYDVDGNDRAPGGLGAVRNPSLPGYATRPARFLRIEKAVSQFDDDVVDPANTAFGPNRALGMRDILGYAPIEPDGSVMVKVPANVALNLTVLDARGRRLNSLIGRQHANWLQAVPGERLECNGCHDAVGTTQNPPRAHGRPGLTTAVNTGAATVGAFPGANPALAAVEVGETMAQVRNRVMCGGVCAPSVNIVFDDAWVPSGPTAATSFDMCFVAGPSGVPSDPANTALRHACATKLDTALPVASSCSESWNSRCRVTIHYEQHIHPLWGRDRFVDANNDGMNDVDAMGNPINHKCSTCHNPANAANMAQVPGGDLDLTDGASEDEPDQFRAYRELLFGDVGQVVNAMGQLEDECLDTQIDPVTNTPVCVTFRQVSASMNAGNAGTSRFFSKFDAGGGTVDHRGFLTPAELKLLAEWLDIGAQYYNDPFVAPEN